MSLRALSLLSSRSTFGARDERRTSVLAARTVSMGVAVSSNHET